MSTIIRPNQLSSMLASDIQTIEKFKTDPSIPMEVIPPLTDIQRTLLDHPMIPESSHARDHFFSYNDEIVGIVKSVLANYKGDTKDLGASIGRPILDSRMVEYGTNKIRQIKISLIEPVPSRRAWLPSSLMSKTHLVRRHTSSPGIDFWAPIDELTQDHISTVSTLIMTIRHHADGGFVLGTCYAGDKFPGEDDGTGIFYKWYKDDKDRASDASSFIRVLSEKIPVLLDAGQIQQKILS